MALGTNISISKCNPIRFALVDSNLPSFDNTLFADESFDGITSKHFVQEFEYKDTVLIQIMGEDETPVLTKYVDGVATVIALDNTQVYTDFKIYEYQFSFDDIECFYLTATTSTTSYKSENINIVALNSLSEYYKLEAYNYDPPTENNNWGFDFSTVLAKANVNYLRIPALFLDYSQSGKATIYDNQNEKEIIKQSNFRTLNFESAPIPRYLAEMISIYMGLDVFVVNDVQYVKEENIETERFGGTNLFKLTTMLTQKNVIGINTFDTGFDCDVTTNTEVMNLQLLAVSGQQSLVIPEGYLIQSITAYQVTGTPTIKAGTTVGGSDIMYPISISSVETQTVNQDIAGSGDATLYIDISGAGATANIHVIIIQNRVV